MMNINYVDMFSCPVLVADLDLDINSLKKFCYEKEQENKQGVALSNIGGWQSDNVKNETNLEFVKLKNKIEEAANSYHRDIGFKKDLREVIGNIWININKKDHFNELHQHHFSILSGAYYLNSCDIPIVFRHPFKDINTYFWDSAIIEEYNQASSGMWTVTPSPNTLLIFPAWIEHKVLPNAKNGDRISISFNTTLVNQEGNQYRFPLDR